MSSRRRDLILELRQWIGREAAPTLWWRDDDVVAATPRLSPLLRNLRLPPVLLAVIPALCRDDLKYELENSRFVEVCQHGWAHTNYGGCNSPAEFTEERSLEVMKAEVRRGMSVLKEVFGARFQPIFVPPWNTVPESLSKALPSLGVRLLSTESPRFIAGQETWIPTAPIHIDLCDWRRDGAFIGSELMYERVSRKLSISRRFERRHVPVGILSHHDVIGPDFVHSVSELFMLSSEYGARWLTGGALLNMVALDDQLP